MRTVTIVVVYDETKEETDRWMSQQISNLRRRKLISKDIELVYNTETTTKKE